jgi:ANTAR domain
VPSSDLADRAAALLSLAAATEERSLSQLTALAASQVPGCAAAHVCVWRDGELVTHAASHPELSRLAGVQLRAGRGPLLDALADSTPAACPDTLTEKRWPEFAAAALRIGVRSAVTLAHWETPTVEGRQADPRTTGADTAGSVPDAAVTLSLVGLRPRAMDADQLQLAELLVAYGGALVGAVSEYGDSRRVAIQLRDAASSRAVVDQAKGILMHALSCTADEALDRLREVSQRTNLRATEVAQRVVDAHSRPGGRRGSTAELGQLVELAKGDRKNAG